MSWWSSSSKPDDSESFSSSDFDSGSSFDLNSSQDLGSFSNAGSGSNGFSNQSQAALQEALVAEQQRLEVQRMVMKMADLCFDRCVNKPGQSLSKSESTCISNCAERYLDSKMYVTNRILKQHQS